MKQPKHLLLILLFLGISAATDAQTKVSSLFSDHMVLQQNSEVALWGTDKPGTKIEADAGWGGKSTVVTDKHGKWKLSLKTEKAGGPYTVEIRGTEKILLEDVLLGEVWLCSGQSNMEMPIKGFRGQPVNGSNDLVLNSSNPQLRLFHVGRNMSREPLDSCEGTWQQSSPEAVLKFSAVAYLYGKMLQEKINVPVGIICSSFGGTRAEAWTRKKTLADEGFGTDTKDHTEKINKNDPSVLYNAMIHPLIPYGIKGVIWYQGESNRGNHGQYAKLFPTMINSWRKEWNSGEFPFYFVQIAPFEYKPDINSAFLREAQLHALQNTSNTGMAVTLDIGEKHCIHPAEKEEVAKRLSYWALAKTYGYKGIQYSGPVYKSMEVKGSEIHLHFDYAPDGVSSFGKALDHFTIAGADKVFYPAKAEIKRGELIVSSDQVARPVAVRYGWENYLEGCLFNLAGLPASSFRTDHWED
ncbi:sialate O-acetylesterase [Sinomicrobium weinanense]|uniref:Sialate O-acetylesterase n=1 Tax=Sinomicrobium weinanense TaxID=2842200 RepID=A0A926JVY9_9FLAO|nr:sialate O-acetylesterase [Sinomicrobium weinanense]MBC9798587.1 sialate O-acetylesterase [Sinomicrobium weinanense]MBU3125856.1 sialate O-acetylesterase [Sinomicrobium weinanense]